MIAEAEELDRGPVPGGAGRGLVVGGEHVEREAGDRVRRPVADLEGGQGLALDPDVRQEPLPRREARVLRDVLPGVAGEGDGALFIAGAEEHLHLDRREVLHLVEHRMGVDQGLAPTLDGAHAELPQAEQQGVVFGVEAGVLLVVALGEGLQRLGLHRDPRDRPVELLVVQVVADGGLQRGPVGQHRREVFDELLGVFAPGRAGDVPGEEVHHRRVQLQAHDGR
ncbi:MAG: hypothetical protein ACK559_25020, partial [bacterium]